MGEKKKVSLFSKLFKKDTKNVVEQTHEQPPQQTQEQSIKTEDYDATLSQHILTKNIDNTSQIPLDSLKPYEEEIDTLSEGVPSINQEVSTTPEITSESLGIKPEQISSGNVEEGRPNLTNLQENKVEDQVPIFNITPESLNEKIDTVQPNQEQVVAPDLSEFVDNPAISNEQRPVINNAAVNPVIFVEDGESKGISR